MRFWFLTIILVLGILSPCRTFSIQQNQKLLAANYSRNMTDDELRYVTNAISSA